MLYGAVLSYSLNHRGEDEQKEEKEEKEDEEEEEGEPGIRRSVCVS